MKVKELKKLLEKCNDEAVLVVPSSDHSYRGVTAYKTTAIKQFGHLFEDHDLLLEKDESRVAVLLFTRPSSATRGTWTRQHGTAWVGLKRVVSF